MRVVGGYRVVLHWRLEGFLALELLDLALQPPHGVDTLENSSVAHPVTSANQSSREREPTLVVALAEVGVTVLESARLVVEFCGVHEESSSPLGHQSEVFDGLDLAGGEGIVCLQPLDLLQGVGDVRHALCFQSC